MITIDTIMIFSPIEDNYKLAKILFIKIFESILCEPNIKLTSTTKSNKYSK